MEAAPQPRKAAHFKYDEAEKPLEETIIKSYSGLEKDQMSFDRTEPRRPARFNYDQAPLSLENTIKKSYSRLEKEKMAAAAAAAAHVQLGTPQTPGPPRSRLQMERQAAARLEALSRAKDDEARAAAEAYQAQIEAERIAVELAAAREAAALEEAERQIAVAGQVAAEAEAAAAAAAEAKNFSYAPMEGAFRVPEVELGKSDYAPMEKAHYRSTVVLAPLDGPVEPIGLAPIETEEVAEAVPDFADAELQEAIEVADVAAPVENLEFADIDAEEDEEVDTFDLAPVEPEEIEAVVEEEFGAESNFEYEIAADFVTDAASIEDYGIPLEDDSDSEEKFEANESVIVQPVPETDEEEDLR